MMLYECDEYIDFVVFSVYKCYFLLNGGVLVGFKKFFEKFNFVLYGLGFIKFVNDNKILYVNVF